MIKVFSFGGGVQSTAALVLAAQSKIDFSTFLFCNVGEDSEHPATLQYYREVGRPYAEKHGIELIELQRIKRDGNSETLYQRITRPNTRTIDIPVRMFNGAPGNRSCTGDFKIKVVDRWLKEHGAATEGAQVGLGISLDEFQRMKPNMDPATPWKENVFPLIDMHLDRRMCREIIIAAGLPVPPKSSCWFCPFNDTARWQRLREDNPDLFQKALDLEQLLNKKREDLGRNRVYLSGKAVPLSHITTDLKQGSLFEEEEDICDSGHCFV